VALASSRKSLRTGLGTIQKNLHPSMRNQHSTIRPKFNQVIEPTAGTLPDSYFLISDIRVPTTLLSKLPNSFLCFTHHLGHCPVLGSPRPYSVL
jgi:hypothetical protein